MLQSHLETAECGRQYKHLYRPTLLEVQWLFYVLDSATDRQTTPRMVFIVFHCVVIICSILSVTDEWPALHVIAQPSVYFKSLTVRNCELWKYTRVCSCVVYEVAPLPGLLVYTSMMQCHTVIADLIRLAHLVWEPSLSVAASVVCLSRARSRKLREIRAKFRRLYRKAGSSFARELAKYPKSSPKPKNSPT